MTRNTATRAAAMGAAAALVAACSVVLIACGSLADRYCQTAADCNSPLDGVGESDDSVAVCAIETQTELDAYRANSEEVCLEVADAKERLMACSIEAGCDAWDLGSNDCDDEYTDLFQALDRAQGRCSE